MDIKMATDDSLGEEERRHDQGREGAARDATLHAIVVVLNQTGMAESFLSTARPLEAIELLKTYGMEEDLDAYISASHAAKHKVPLSSVGNGRNYPISIQEKFDAIKDIRRALFADPVVRHHDPVEVRRSAMECLQGGEQMNDFRAAMYRAIITEVGQSNALAGAEKIIATYDECAAHGAFGKMLKLIGKNSHRQERWRSEYKSRSEKINDVVLFEKKSGPLTYQGLYEAASEVVAAQRHIEIESRGSGPGLG